MLAAVLSATGSTFMFRLFPDKSHLTAGVIANINPIPLPLGAPGQQVLRSSPTGPSGTPKEMKTVNVINHTCAFPGLTCQKLSAHFLYIVFLL